MTEEVVRIATPADEDEIMTLFTIMHAEGGFMPLDEMEARATLHRAFNRQGGIIGVIGEPGDIKAMIYLLISRFWYTTANHLEELFNFVRPDVRKSNQNYAATMIAFAKKCADSIGIPLTIGVLTNHRMEGKVRLYRRSLGVPAGAWFVYGSIWKLEEHQNEDFWLEPFPRRGRGSSEKKLRVVRGK